MLYIEHINLVVKDITQTLRFYQAAFPHWRVRGEGQNEWSGRLRNWCHFGDDNYYLTFNDNGEGSSRDLKGHQVGVAHFAFALRNIDALQTRLAEAGFYPSNIMPPTEYRRNIYYIDPNGFEVEFVAYKSDIPSQRNHD